MYSYNNMRIEIVILLIGAVLIYNVYTDGLWLRKIMSYKKYMTIGAIIVGSLFLCWLFRRNPSSAVKMLQHSNEYLKYLPIDGGATQMITPILDFTLNKTFPHSVEQPFVDMNMQSVEVGSIGSVGSQGSVVGGGSKTKRSVSESKKRFVASQQNWLCKKCGEMLPPTYEIDHVVRLDRGGSNELSNLAALCPSCHRHKTLMENM